MSFDHRNTIVGCLTALAIVVIVVVGIVVGDHNANVVRIEKTKTERVRIEACRSIEDEAIRALCINKEQT